MYYTTTFSFCTTENMDPSHSPRQKLIIILGTTAVGKTKLSVQLAQELTKYLSPDDDQNVKPQAEIISADSVQVYRGMEICSDAITEEEAQGIPHHLVGSLAPHQPYTVQDFVASASSIIDDIHRRHKIPIIAGGTLYYSESLLFKNFCSENAMKLKDKNNDQIQSNEVQQKLDGIPDVNLWSELDAVDPLMARFYHQNDHRRIRRSLEVYFETGRLHSDLIKEHGGKWSDLRYDALILWLDAELEVIDHRINSRLTTMEQSGIFEEIENLYQFFIAEYGYDALSTDSNSNGKNTDKSNGKPPYISIAHGFGFQAFVPWLRAKYKEKIIDKMMIQKVRRECIERYGLDTRRYARKQRRWLKNRISRPALLLPIYRFDTSEKERWNDIVLRPAVDIVTSFLENKPIDQEIIKHLESVNKLGDIKEMERSVEITSLEQWQNFECEHCEKVLHGQTEFDIHFKSKKHQKRVRNVKRQQINNFLRFSNYRNVKWREMCSF